jgi:hypothetical protein
VLIGSRLITFSGTATDAKVTSFKDLYQPTTPNGCSYLVTSAGGTLANPVNNSLWSTNLGESFVSGTATLRVVKECLPGTTVIESYAECYIESQSGAMQVYLYVDFGGGKGGTALIPSAPDANTKHTRLPTYMRLKSQRFVLPASATIWNSYVKFVGTAGGSANFYVPIHGLRVV